MEIKEKQEGFIVILDLKGNLVGEELKKLENKLLLLNGEKKNKVVINLENIDVMDSMAVDIINNAIQKGIHIKLVHFPKKMLNFFHHAEINTELNMYTMEKAAVQSLLDEDVEDQKALSSEKRESPRIPASLPAAIIIKNDVNDIIYPNAVTRNISSNGAWIEYADVSQIYDFKALFSFGLKEKSILELFLDTTSKKNNKSGKKDGLQLECDLLRVSQSRNFLGLGVKFKEELKHTRFISILP